MTKRHDDIAVRTAPAALQASGALLSTSDLRVVSEEEPRLQDLRIAEALGFERPRKIRELIVRSMSELTRFGTCATVAHVVRGNQVTEFWLNEEQALLIATISDAPRAAEVRHMLIKLFVGWRRGQLPPAPQGASRVDPMGAALSGMAERLAAVEAAIGFRARTSDASFAASLAQMPIWKNGKRPRWWSDLEVRTFLTSTHRQATMAEVRFMAIERFGRERVPSCSSLHRYWQLLDRISGASPSMGVH
ncbi:MAG: hypothetical protein DI589_25565 [Shinella sp.]|jgi:hypothetical protein|nr:MAG: hypothetical protein DI589_25565 [Shinella sp.]